MNLLYDSYLAMKIQLARHLNLSHSKYQNMRQEMDAQNNNDTMKKEALVNKVEKALSSVKHPNVAKVLEDVQSHLDQRFAALKHDEQTRENLEGIISEMGPAAEYAELLTSKTVHSSLSD